MDHASFFSEATLIEIGVYQWPLVIVHGLNIRLKSKTLCMTVHMHYCFNVSLPANTNISLLLTIPGATANKIIKLNTSLVFCVVQSIFHDLQ